MTIAWVLLLLLLDLVHGQCPLNSRRSPGHDFCISCGVGEVSQGDDTISCTRCPAGTRAGRGTCEPCDAGTFSHSLSDACLLCPVGTVAPEAGMSSCTICPSDQIAFGSIECRKCPVGHQVGNDSSSCVPCPQGYARQLFDGQCVQCLPGSHTAFTGAAECTLCSTGRFSSKPGSSSCDACPAGFSSTPGLNETCVPCPEGTTTLGQGGECAVESGDAGDQSNQYRLSEGAVAAYSYALGSVLLFLAIVGLLGQRWYDRLQKRDEILI